MYSDDKIHYCFLLPLIYGFYSLQFIHLLFGTGYNKMRTLLLFLGMSNQLQQQQDNESFVTHLLNFIIGIYPVGNNSFIQASATATLTL